MVGELTGSDGRVARYWRGWGEGGQVGGGGGVRVRCESVPS